MAKTNQRKRKIKTVVEATRSGKDKPGSIRLKRAWSLTSCQRLAALAESFDEGERSIAAAAERKKAITAKLEAGGMTSAQEGARARDLWHVTRDLVEAKDRRKATVLDTMRLLFELSDNGTIFEHAGAADQEPDEAKGQGQLVDTVGAGEGAPA